jgi:hypothetical protein
VAGGLWTGAQQDPEAVQEIAFGPLWISCGFAADKCATSVTPAVRVNDPFRPTLFSAEPITLFS